MNVEKEKKFGPYRLRGPTQEMIWDGHSYCGENWGSEIGDLEVKEKFSDDWTVLEGTFVSKTNPHLKGEIVFRRVKVTKDSTLWGGTAKTMGIPAPLKLTISKKKLVLYSGERRHTDKIEPPISNEDWAEFTGQKIRKRKS